MESEGRPKIVRGDLVDELHVNRGTMKPETIPPPITTHVVGITTTEEEST